MLTLHGVCKFTHAIMATHSTHTHMHTYTHTQMHARTRVHTCVRVRVHKAQAHGHAAPPLSPPVPDPALSISG